MRSCFAQVRCWMGLVAGRAPGMPGRSAMGAVVYRRARVCAAGAPSVDQVRDLARVDFPGEMAEGAHQHLLRSIAGPDLPRGATPDPQRGLTADPAPAQVEHDPRQTPQPLR